MTALRSRPGAALSGICRVPGDKSISHRALMLGALAVGTSRIEGLLEGEDIMATAGALRHLGAGLERTADGLWQVEGVGVGGLCEPDTILDMGNAGTGVRLLMGILAGHDFTSFLSGDASLRRRPMRRITEPLEQMGAEFVARSGGLLPIAVRGSAELLPIDYRSKVASAQIKSAILLAGLHAPGITRVIEPLQSRDHTERMLRAMGAKIESQHLECGGWQVAIAGQPELEAVPIVVPGDPSSAAFPLVAALIARDAEIRIDGVGINPLRTGLLATLKEMGADFSLENSRDVAGETLADIVVRGSDLKGIDVPAERAPSMIDEYPVLAVAAAFANGQTRMRGLHELRVKETDRLTATARNLEACGVEVRIEGDDLLVAGGRTPRGGAVIDAEFDHRIAMSFLLMGLASHEPVTVQGAETIATSFPGFDQLMRDLGATIEMVA